MNLLVTQSRSMTTKRGQAYWRLAVRRAGETSEITCLAWSDVARGAAPSVGSVLCGCVTENDEYNGEPQLKLTALSEIHTKPSRETLEPFRTPNVLGADAAIVRARVFLPEWQTADVGTLLHSLIRELSEGDGWNRLLDCPGGSRNHHAVRGGLLQHLDEMLQIALVLRPLWVGPLVDWELLYAAIALHDIGKLDEYDCDVIAWSPTHRGQMLGHPAIGAALVERHWPQSGCRDRKARLQHAILCHHGRSLSPVTPCTAEAVLLHSIDGISASLSVFRDLPAGEFSGMLGCVPWRSS